MKAFITSLIFKPEIGSWLFKKLLCLEMELFYGFLIQSGDQLLQFVLK